MQLAISVHNARYIGAAQQLIGDRTCTETKLIYGAQHLCRLVPARLLSVPAEIDKERRRRTKSTIESTKVSSELKRCTLRCTRRVYIYSGQCAFCCNGTSTRRVIRRIQVCLCKITFLGVHKVAPYVNKHAGQVATRNL